MSPRKYPPRRTLVSFRISDAGLARIDALAAKEGEGVDRSEMIRRLLLEAVAARAAAELPAP